MSEALPQRLGKYPIVRVLGEGAMGVVYEAFDPVIRRPLAIKTIRRELLDGADSGIAAAARFRNEAQAAGRLSHPGIASVYEFGEEERCAFIAMEFVPGNSLREYFSRRTRFVDQDVLSIMVQLLDALEHAHLQGVWHRDIKPANLMITRNGRLKVTDFGVARIEAAGLTLDGSVIGTPGYMAPEQYSGEGIDRRVDIYACGVVFYQLLTGRAPFSGTQESVMYKTLTEEPAPPSSVEGAEHCARFDRIVLTALAKKVGERFASAEDFRAALVLSSALPVSASVSEDTLIMDAVRPEVPGAAAKSGALRGSIFGIDGAQAGGGESAAQAGRGAASLAPASDTTPTHATRWDATVLAELEARLSRHVGPVARVLVRRAAASCTDVATLTSMLVDQISDESDRTAFRTAIRRAAPAGGESTSATRLATRVGVPDEAASSQRPVSQAQTDDPLTAAFLDGATQVLAAQIGPIAKILVRKAAQRATGREAFCVAVIASCPELEHPDAVLAELMRCAR